jgi:hypothetical protein
LSPPPNCQPNAMPIANDTATMNGAVLNHERCSAWLECGVVTNAILVLVMLLGSRPG